MWQISRPPLRMVRVWQTPVEIDKCLLLFGRLFFSEFIEHNILKTEIIDLVIVFRNLP